MKKFNKKQRGGFVNQSFGITDEVKERNEKRLGKLWNSIDFQMHEDFSFEEYPTGPQKIGYLHLGNAEFELTYAECNRILHTVHEAMQTAKKKYQIGI